MLSSTVMYPHPALPDVEVRKVETDSRRACGSYRSGPEPIPRGSLQPRTSHGSWEISVLTHRCATCCSPGGDFFGRQRRQHKLWTARRSRRTAQGNSRSARRRRSSHLTNTQLHWLRERYKCTDDLQTKQRP